MVDLKNTLMEQKEEIERMISEVEKRLRSEKSVDRKGVRYSKRKNGFQYYLTGPDGRRGYVRAENIDVVIKKIQKGYDEDIYDVMRKLHRRLDEFLRHYDIGAVSEVYESMSDAQRKFVTPVIVPDEVFIEKWIKEHKGNMNKHFESGHYLTDRGDYVRSKSEKILADIFYKKGIPYAYEPRFELKDGCVMFPDFVLLNIRTRKTVYWEHFGLITNSEYAVKTLHKMDTYDKNGIVINEDILFSMESDDMPFDVNLIEKKIKRYLI